MRKTAQGFTTDLLIAVVIFFVVISVFYGLSIHRTAEDKAFRLTQEVRTSIDVLETGLGRDSPAVVDQGKLNESLLKVLYSKTPEELKKYFSTKDDICFVITTSNDRIIPLRNPSGVGMKIGLGSEKFNISGCLCGVEYSNITYDPTDIFNPYTCVS